MPTFKTSALLAARKPNFKLTGSHCSYCGVELCISVTGGSGRNRPPNLLTVDHVKPTSRGGEDKASNLTLCCFKCNAHKGDRPVETFRPEANQPAITI